MKLHNSLQDCQIGDGVLDSKAPFPSGCPSVMRYAKRQPQEFRPHTGKAYAQAAACPIFIFERCGVQIGDGPILSAWKRIE